MVSGAAVGDWVWWLSGWGVVVLGALVLVWALFADRARGRRRCSSCWYDMGRVVGLTCPECGRAAASERGVLRTRRRWRWAIAGVLVGLFGWQVTDGRRVGEGITRVIPTTAARVAAWVAGDRLPAPNPIGQLLFSRQVYGEGAAVAEYRSLTMTVDQARGTIRTRRKWPLGVQPQVWYGNLVPATPVTRAWTLVVQGRDEGPPWVTLSLHPKGWLLSPLMGIGGGNRNVWGLAERPVGVYRERFIVRIESEEKRTLGRWNVDLPFEVVGTLDEAVPPLDSPELSQALWLAVRVRETSYGSEASFEVETSGLIPGLGMAPLTGDVLIDGKVVTQRVRGEFRVVPPGAAVEGPGVVASPTGNVRGFAIENIRLRLTGDQKAALWDFDAAGYWAGTMDVSLKELVEWGSRGGGESGGGGVGP